MRPPLCHWKWPHVVVVVVVNSGGIVLGSKAYRQLELGNALGSGVRDHVSPTTHTLVS